ncbi:MAG: tetraacyldisaccharide 4'-kinase [Chitinophagaceae bacterium]|nr:tetraacyldisaccharide 4'-kinase [Chitinophagaceae bacterium]
MKKLILSILKYASLPFALLYGLVVFLRNKFYDLGIFNSIEFSLPVICVGNITVGGTGKSPHIEYLIELLSTRYKVATLSRGYGRHSRGFRIADPHTNAREIGDEPYQFKSKYPFVEVAVAEERMTAIPQLLQRKPQLDIILLDDAFQHRTVRAGFNILLTDYGRLFTKDYIMPFGLLRESRKAAKRAQTIIVSKCPPDMSEKEKLELTRSILPLPGQTIYFSSIVYQNIYPLTPDAPHPNSATEILLVCGIANPEPLVAHLKTKFKTVNLLRFKDHHYYTDEDIEEIKAAFDHIKTTNKTILTTEKDAARLMLHKDLIHKHQLPFFAQGIRTRFLFNEGEAFNEEITRFVQQYIPDLPQDEIYEEITPQ